MITLASILGTNLFTAVFKKAVAKYGDTGVHLMVFGFSIIATAIWAFAQYSPTFMDMLKHMAAIGLSAIGLYEFVWKKVGAALDTTNIGMSSSGM